MKLVSLNVEGKKHPTTVFPFLAAQAADVVCLTEAPEDWCMELEQLGYHTTFAPMLIRTRTETYVEGVIFASKEPHQAITEYYHGSASDISEYHKGENREAIAHPVIVGSVTIDGQVFTVATTHVMVTPNGLADEHQRQGIRTLLEILNKKEPHVLCGDFNMPRGYNELYAEITQNYTDTVPVTYSSSLDKNIHRLGNSETLTEPIFEKYMVDYIFTQPPYEASEVTLHFNLSDHAAVVGEIRKVS